MKTLRKAVFPVAGLGTRFLPATKALPKEMLPVVDKPLIQYAVEEAVEAGIDHLVFVTGHTKKAIEDHFDRSPELEAALEARGREELLGRVRSILPSHVTCLYIRQPAPLGLGHAVLCARPAIGDEPFAVLLPDDLVACDGPGCITQMARCFERTGHCLVAVESVPREETGRYGIVSLASPGRDGGPIRGIVEKPVPARAPSTLGVVGRYVLTPGFSTRLRTPRRGRAERSSSPTRSRRCSPAKRSARSLRGNPVRLRLEGRVPGCEHPARAQATRASRRGAGVRPGRRLRAAAMPIGRFSATDWSSRYYIMYSMGYACPRRVRPSLDTAMEMAGGSQGHSNGLGRIAHVPGRTAMEMAVGSQGHSNPRRSRRLGTNLP